MTTETLPAVAPLEPTTPIKPSEAIRLGCLLAPLAYQGGWGHGEYACVNRALYLGRFGDDDSWYAYGRVDKLLGHLTPPCGWDCPEWDGYAPARVPSWALIHLNDEHDWSRERIADWLEGLGL